MSEESNNSVVRFIYRNHRGETATRRVIPTRIEYTATPWHPEPQWILWAVDLDRRENRGFAMSEIRDWTPEGEEVKPMPSLPLPGGGVTSCG